MPDHRRPRKLRADAHPDGSPNTAHTRATLHFIYVARDAAKFRCEDGILADVAPTLCFCWDCRSQKMTRAQLLVPIQSPNSYPSQDRSAMFGRDLVPADFQLSI